MITTTHFDNSTPKRISLSHLPRDGIIWVDIQKPNKEEIEKISKTFKLLERDIRDALDEKELSRIIERRSYSVVILQSPLKSKERQRDTATIGIFVTANIILTIHRRRINPLNTLKEGNFKGGTVNQLMHRILTEINNDFFKLTEEIDEGIEELEEKVIKENHKKIAQKIFDLRHNLIYFQKALVHNREVLAELRDGKALHLQQEDKEKFGRLYNDTIQLIAQGDTHKEILTSALEIHVSTLSNAMNDVVKKLTVIAAFAMVPTLIASIYGMNFKVMPEILWPNGYYFSLGLMGLSVLTLFIYFKRKKWI